MHRILGYRDFYGLRLSLSPETLEPRPDTETLVEAVLPSSREMPRGKAHCRILDLGTGTGAIALALLSAVPAAIANGVDISEGALATASRNAAEAGLADRFTPLHSDWFSASFRPIPCNCLKPSLYTHSKSIGNLQDEVRDFDPRQALMAARTVSTPTGSSPRARRRILDDDGRVAVEIGHTQRNEVTSIYSRQPATRLIAAHRDLGGNDRVLCFRL